MTYKIVVWYRLTDDGEYKAINYKKQILSNERELLSMSQFLSSQKIEELDGETQYYVDLSSLIGFVKTNDTQMLHFEQLFNSFGENITFICDKIYVSQRICRKKFMMKLWALLMLSSSKICVI